MTTTAAISKLFHTLCDAPGFYNFSNRREVKRSSKETIPRKRRRIILFLKTKTRRREGS